MRAADRIAPGHFVQRLGFGSDKTYIFYIAEQMDAIKLRLANDRIFPDSFRDDLDLDNPEC